jgi:L-ascorbate metabolism protein UlaG (beta-lactamase superfamily)
MKLTLLTGDVKVFSGANLPDQAVGLAWLGQAGFAVRHAGCRFLIDPYLSDHLARKYSGSEFPHERLMPPPIRADEVRDLDLVLCSHAHGDHMDPGSLSVLANNNPRCRFIVPRAEVETVVRLGVSAERVIPVNSGDTFWVSDTFTVQVIPAAHETLKVNERGEHHFLGFILKLGALTVYHSGDSVVYDGLVERLRENTIDLALLPVNGRRDDLTSRGVMGNMSFEEAATLCLAAGIGLVIPHHFGMFAFNTVDAIGLKRQAAHLDSRLHCCFPTVEYYYLLEPLSKTPNPNIA